MKSKGGDSMSATIRCGTKENSCGFAKYYCRHSYWYYNCCVFSSDSSNFNIKRKFDVDTNKLAAIVEENISDEQMAQLNLCNDTMEKIENELDDKKLPKYKTQAEIIYAFYLSDKSETKDFVKSFTSCFEKNM